MSAWLSGYAVARRDATISLPRSETVKSRGSSRSPRNTGCARSPPTVATVPPLGLGRSGVAEARRAPPSASATPERPNPRGGTVATVGGERAQPVLRGDRELPRDFTVSLRGSEIVASRLATA